MKIRHGVIIAVVTAALGYCGKLQFDESEARAEAEAVAAALLAHRNRSGAYPASLAEVGFDPQALRDKWYLSYRLDGAKPFLFYSVQNNWMVTNHYDFESRTWKLDD